MTQQLIITCEHAGNEVPEEYRHLFKHASKTLNTHRGIDFGALELTNTVAKKLKQEPFLHTVTRLLVDLNRSVQHPTLFSEFTRDESVEVRENIFERYYQPHRKRVEQRVKEIIDQGNQVLHIGIHTFTPIWEDEERQVDVGFLFDPRRLGEKDFARRWRSEVSRRLPDLRLKMNEPYRGTMDGFTTYLRRIYPENNYLGLELEVSQRFFLGASEDEADEWQMIQNEIAESLRVII